MGIWIAALCCIAFSGEADSLQPDDPIIAIDYPESLPLDALVDYVSRTLDVRIVYGDELRNQQVVLRPGHIELPRSRLPDFLRSVLEIRGFVLVEGELEDFYRIVRAEEMSRIHGDVRSEIPEGPVVPGRIVTQVLPVPSGDTKTLAARLKEFTSSSKASLVEIPEKGLLIVTDYEPAVLRLAHLVEIIDRPGVHEIEIVPITHMSPQLLADRVMALLGSEYSPETLEDRIDILADIVPGNLVISGTHETVSKALNWISRLDVPFDDDRPLTRYVLECTSAQRLKQLIENTILGGTKDPSVHLHVDSETNSIYVAAPTSIQSQIRDLIHKEDRATPESASRLRVYRPRNRTAADILETLTHLLEEATVSFTTQDLNNKSSDTSKPVGPNRPPAEPGQVPPTPPAAEVSMDEETTTRKGMHIRGPDYVLTEDEATNAIIAVGTPEFHTQLSALIDELDRRRSQVMIEMKLVAVTINDGLDVGVELQALDLGEAWNYILFSSFGLSEVDVTTGARTFVPGMGANGVLMSPTETPILFRALATHANTKVISTPRLVVGDNTTGTLRNVDEAPFTSVNASDTVATTSFAGFESAGTTLTVTPHVAEGDHLVLDYDLTFSNFSGQSSTPTVPPPRITNSFVGEVEVPDGYTVVVGGLVVEHESDSVSEVPLLGRIPILGVLFQSSSTTHQRSRIFAFIRPVILRDDQFRDLKFITSESLKMAKLEDTDFPVDLKLWMR